jgi:phosphoribosylformimino-5-aminoimidazole carboxamide ribotide isomerase
MIMIIPAISIMGGKLAKYSTDSQEKWYNQSPLDLAMYFEDNGVDWIHFVDIDGAHKERLVNAHVLEILCKYTKLKVNFSGGIRVDGDIQTAFDCGAKTVTVASLAVYEPETVKSWLITYGAGRIIMGADVIGDKLATRGWLKTSDINYIDHIDHFYNRGVQFLKCTDVERDGVMLGPNFEMYQKVREKFPNLNLVASGGVRNIQDIEKLDEMGLFGVIIARAIYENRINFSDLKPFFNR